MVSNRCKIVVKSELEKFGFHCKVLELGEIEIQETISENQKVELRRSLLQSGLELMDDKKSILIEKIKNVIIEMVHYLSEEPKTKNSVYISKKLNHNYTFLLIYLQKQQELRLNNTLSFLKLNEPKN